MAMNDVLNIQMVLGRKKAPHARREVRMTSLEASDAPPWNAAVVGEKVAALSALRAPLTLQ